jgi:hypothetical protein
MDEDKGEPTNFRLERIEKLLFELRYEIERGLFQREIAEEMLFQFVFPISQKIPGGCVAAEFRMRPMTYNMFSPGEPRLKVVK